jgi:isoquinoline 1-oxidoreductase alpha subunit
MELTINVNGAARTCTAQGEMPLLWVLRDKLQMTGTKFGCGAGLCGACTVLVDGVPTRSCQTQASGAAGKAVTTIEGLQSREAKAVVQAWRERDVVQCGWCQSGQIVAATALLTAKPTPTDKDIDAAMSGNLCRCGTYQRIRLAIHDAAKILKGA